MIANLPSTKLTTFTPTKVPPKVNSHFSFPPSICRLLTYGLTDIRALHFSDIRSGAAPLKTNSWAIIFDFGDVFINLDKQKIDSEFRKLGLTAWHEDLDALHKQYELGKIDELEYMSGFQKHLPKADLVSIRSAWNSILGDFPLYRLEFLQMIASKYRLFLLSNTDHTHIEKFEHNEGLTFARDFYSCF